MQLEAPIPIPILNDNILDKVPPYLGRDYHGPITHVEAASMLEHQPNGSYLVRNSPSSKGKFHTLSLKYDQSSVMIPLQIACLFQIQRPNTSLQVVLRSEEWPVCGGQTPRLRPLPGRRWPGDDVLAAEGANDSGTFTGC